MTTSDSTASAASPVTDGPRASDHVPPVTPVTRDAVAVPVQVNESTPISDRNLVGSVMVTLTLMARVPSAATVYWS